MSAPAACPSDRQPPGRLRRSAAAAAATVALLSCVACGSAATPPSSPSAIVHAAIARTIDARTAALSLSFSATVDSPTNGSQTVSTTSTGSFDLATGTGTVTTPLLPLGVTGTEVTMTVTPSAFSWLAPTTELASLPRGTVGAVVVPCDAAALSSAAPAALFELASLTPAQYLSFLGSVSGQVRSIGVARIAGTPAHGYSYAVDLRAMESAGSAGQNGTTISQAGVDLVPGLVRSEIAFLGRSTIPVRAWIDGKGRLVRVSVPTLQATTGSVAVVATLTAFGKRLPQRPATPKVAYADLETVVRAGRALPAAACSAGRAARAGKLIGS